MRLTAAAILAADDLKRDEVECPEWGGSVLVRELTAGDRLRFQALAKDASEELSAEVVAMGSINDDGTLLFTAADVARLAGKNAEPVERVAKAILVLSGLMAAGKQIAPEQAEKN